MTKQQMDVLAKIASKEIAPEEGAKLIEALEPAKPQGKLTLKVSVAKPERKGADGKMLGATKGGGLILQGLARFPLTLYKGQWKRLIAFVPEITAFLAAHDAELADKTAS